MARTVKVDRLLLIEALEKRKADLKAKFEQAKIDFAAELALYPDKVAAALRERASKIESGKVKLGIGRWSDVSTHVSVDVRQPARPQPPDTRKIDGYLKTLRLSKEASVTVNAEDVHEVL